MPKHFNKIEENSAHNSKSFDQNLSTMRSPPGAFTFGKKVVEAMVSHRLEKLYRHRKVEMYRLCFPVTVSTASFLIFAFKQYLK